MIVDLIHYSNYLPLASVFPALIAFGVKEFATVNKIFTVLNIGVICFVVIAGLTQADLHNWNLTPEEIVNISIAKWVSNLRRGTGDYSIVLQ